MFAVFSTLRDFLLPLIPRLHTLSCPYVKQDLLGTLSRDDDDVDENET